MYFADLLKSMRSGTEDMFTLILYFFCASLQNSCKAKVFPCLCYLGNGNLMVLKIVSELPGRDRRLVCHGVVLRC